MEIIKEFEQKKVIPVVVFKSLDEVDSTMTSLIKGDLKIAEVCFRTVCALDAIKIVKEKYPEITLGAGTVINEKQCLQAIKAGVKFIVSPGFSEKIARICKKNKIFYLPGVVTPTEIMAALDCGLTYLKFFPAGVYGGLKAIKALSAAFPQVKFMPTGGVNLDNLNEFLAEKSIFAIGGSFITKGDIFDNCKKVKEIIKKGE